MGSREKFPVTAEYQVELDNRYAPPRYEADLHCSLLLGGATFQLSTAVVHEHAKEDVSLPF
jgi:hypothetical protein